MSENTRLLELLISEVKELRSDIHAQRKEFYTELASTRKEVTTLKLRFTVIAVTMGLAGGKLSAILPFLK